MNTACVASHLVVGLMAVEEEILRMIVSSTLCDQEMGILTSSTRGTLWLRSSSSNLSISSSFFSSSSQRLNASHQATRTLEM